jgi:hypothetical protein
MCTVNTYFISRTPHGPRNVTLSPILTRFVLTLVYCICSTIGAKGVAGSGCGDMALFVEQELFTCKTRVSSIAER